MGACHLLKVLEGPGASPWLLLALSRGTMAYLLLASSAVVGALVLKTSWEGSCLLEKLQLNVLVWSGAALIRGRAGSRPMRGHRGPIGGKR